MLLPKGIEGVPDPREADKVVSDAHLATLRQQVSQHMLALTQVDLTPFRIVGERVAEFSRVVQSAAESYRQTIRPLVDALAAFKPLIHFPIPTIRFPPQIGYLLGASRGDRGAARWLAENIHWEPDAPTTKLLALHARIKRQPPEQIWIETLADAFLNILRNRETLLAFHIRGAGTIITPEGSPLTAKVGELSIPFLYKWVQTEAVRHALNVLMGAPYSLQVILERQPAEGEDEMDLLAWPETTSFLQLLPPSHWGRPAGSTSIPLEIFPELYRRAYNSLLDQDRDRRPTQIEIAAELAITRWTLRNYLQRLNLPWPPR